MNRNHLNNFERGPSKDHSCQVWSNSHQWFRRRCCLKIVDGRTSGQRRRQRWRRTVSDHNSSPWAFGSGELIKQVLPYISFSSLRFINNSKFILNATSLGSNCVLIIRVQSRHHDSLNNLGRGSAKKNSSQVIFKSVHWFLTRRFLKFSI